MQLRSEIQISSMLKAMKEMVIPAIDPTNHLAVEQSQLVVGMLSLMQHQLPLQFLFDRDELRRLIGTLEKLEEISSSDAALGEYRSPLSASRARAEALMRHCAVDPTDLYQAVRALREQIGNFTINATAQASPDSLNQIERTVLGLSREQLLRDRALLAPQGWEPDPAALPSIQTLLATVELSAQEQA